MALDSLVNTGLDAAGASFGLPPGVASGALNSILKIFNIKDLSCIGGQAYKKSTLESDIASLKSKISALTNTQQLADLLTWLSWEIGSRKAEVPRFDSKCSRDYTLQYIANLEPAFAQLYPMGSFYEKPTVKVDHKGAGINCIIYTPKVLTSLNQSSTVYSTSGTVTPNTNDYLNSIGLSGVNTPTTQTQSLTTVDIPSSILAQLTNRSLTSGIPLETLKSTYINGGFTIDNNGKIIWSASAGNNENNTSSYLLLGGGLALVYLAFFKKK